MKLMQKRLVVLAMSAMTLSLTACASTTNSEVASPVDVDRYVFEVDPSWVEPAWMTSHRTIGNEYQNSLFDCVIHELELVVPPDVLADLNVRPVRSQIGWDVSLMATPNPERSTPPDLFDLMGYAEDACRERFPRPDMGGFEATLELYERMLDTRACLIAHGFEMREPPDAETWIALGGTFIPQQQLPLSVRDSEEVIYLYEACPASGPVWYGGRVRL